MGLWKYSYRDRPRERKSAKTFGSLAVVSFLYALSLNSDVCDLADSVDGDADEVAPSESFRRIPNVAVLLNRYFGGENLLSEDISDAKDNLPTLSAAADRLSTPPLDNDFSG